MKRPTYHSFFYLLLSTGLALSGCSDSSSPTEPVNTARAVKAITVTAPDTSLSVSFPGRAEPVHEVNLAFEVSGTLQQLPVQVGDNLEKGQLVAQLKQDTFSARLKAAQARHRKAVNDERRLSNLLISGSVSQTQYDDAQTQLDVLTSQLALYQKTLADATIQAPFAGQVAAVYLDNFTFVPVSTQVARVVDLSQIKMWVDLPETFAVLGSQVTEYKIQVIFDAYPEHPIVATMKEWGHEASRETRTFPISLIMDQPKTFKILPGMSGMAYVEASISELQLESAVYIPASALFTPAAQQDSSVWVVKDHKVQRRSVVVRRISAQGILIESGLHAGEQVVIAGVHSLQEGQVVRILNEESQQ